MRLCPQEKRLCDVTCGRSRCLSKSQSTPVLLARHFDPAWHLKEDVRDFLEGPWFDEAPLPGRGIDRAEQSAARPRVRVEGYLIAA
jgi:hypothetical protein